MPGHYCDGPVLFFLEQNQDMEISEINVVYFSPTGTSGKVAKSVASGASRGHIKINIYDATHKEIMFKALPGSLTIVAVPVYGGHMALTARQRIQNIMSDGTAAIPVVVYGNRDYDAALNELSDMLVRNGFVTVAAATFIGEHSYSSDETPIAAGRPDVDDVDFAVAFGKSVLSKLEHVPDLSAARIDARRIKKPRQPILPLLGFIYNVIRISRSNKPMQMAPVTDENLCTHCGVCVKVCPVAAIEKGSEEKTNASLCIRCCACVKSCPHKARTFSTPFASILARFFGRRKENRTIL